jgi:hypothetical protein
MLHEGVGKRCFFLRDLWVNISLRGGEELQKEGSSAASLLLYTVYKLPANEHPQQAAGSHIGC